MPHSTSALDGPPVSAPFVRCSGPYQTLLLGASPHSLRDGFPGHAFVLVAFFLAVALPRDSGWLVRDANTTRLATVLRRGAINLHHEIIIIDLAGQRFGHRTLREHSTHIVDRVAHHVLEALV